MANQYEISVKSLITRRKIRSLIVNNYDIKTSVWSQRFIVTAILQGSLIILLTSIGIGIQIISSPMVNIIQFLSLSFEGPAKWIFLGYIFYTILTTLIATTAIFYNHLEVNLRKRIQGIKSILAWTNLIGVNIGGAAVAITLIYAGLLSSGILGIITDVSASGFGASTDLRENTTVMNDFVIPIATFAGILIIGSIAGIITYFTTYFQNPEHNKMSTTTEVSEKK